MADNSALRNEIMQVKKEIEKEIALVIKNTKFYKTLKSYFRHWYFVEYERLFLIYGRPGIGKSKTLRDIMNDMNINYKVFLGNRFEFYDMFAILKSAVAKHDLIVFDDCMISKRFVNYLIDLLDKGYKIIIITNDLSELRPAKLFVRAYPLFINMDYEDIQYITNHLAKKYNIEYNNVILLNLRDVVTYTLSALFGIDFKLTIDKIIYETDAHFNNYNILKNIIKRIITNHNILDYNLFESIAKNYFYYSDTTAKKYIRSIIKELYEDSDINIRRAIRMIKLL